MLVKFHKPYHPNDGHGPGSPLPWNVYDFLVSMDGVKGSVQGVIADLRWLWPEAKFEVHSDFIGITHENHHWWGIGYAPMAP